MQKYICIHDFSGSHWLNIQQHNIGRGPLNTKEESNPSDLPLTQSQGIFPRHLDSIILTHFPPNTKIKQTNILSPLPSPPLRTILHNLPLVELQTQNPLLRGEDGEMDIQTRQVALTLILEFRYFSFDLPILTL